MHPTLLRSFAMLVNSHVPLAMSKAYFSCIAASTCSHLRISTLRTNSKNRPKMPHWFFLPCWGRMWLFHHSPSGRHFLLGYLPYLLNLLTRSSFFAGISSASLFEIKWSPTCSLHSWLPLHEDDLEDSSITTTIGHSFLPLWCISKLLPTLVLSSMLPRLYFLCIF